MEETLEHASVCQSRQLDPADVEVGRLTGCDEAPLVRGEVGDLPQVIAHAAIVSLDVTSAVSQGAAVRSATAIVAATDTIAVARCPLAGSRGLTAF